MCLSTISGLEQVADEQLCGPSDVVVSFRFAFVQVETRRWLHLYLLQDHPSYEKQRYGHALWNVSKREIEKARHQGVPRLCILGMRLRYAEIFHRERRAGGNVDTSALYAVFLALIDAGEVRMSW